MTEQVQLELIRSVPLILTAVFSFSGTLVTLWVGQKVKGVHKDLNSRLTEFKLDAEKAAAAEAKAAHAAGMKEEADKHGVNGPLPPQ